MVDEPKGEKLKGQDMEIGSKESRKFTTFEDLDVYKKAREFRKKIYALIKMLPPTERYCLDPQMRSAAISITNNIAEGHGRYHYQENIQFCRQSRGSLEEIMDDLNVCLDEGYWAARQIADLKRDGYELLRLINGYIRYLKKMKEECAV